MFSFLNWNFWNVSEIEKKVSKQKPTYWKTVLHENDIFCSFGGFQKTWFWIKHFTMREITNSTFYEESFFCL